MSTIVLQGIALIAMIVSLPFISWGTMSEVPALVIVGAVLLIAGMGMLTVLRYFGSSEEDAE